MPRRISLSARTSTQAESSADDAIVLIRIEHADLAFPEYLSSHPTERLSLEPLRYGTRSLGVEHNFVLMTAVIPDDQEKMPSAAQLVFDNVDADMAAIARSVTTPATIRLQLVFASAPGAIEYEWSGLSAVKARIDEPSVTIDVTSQPFTAEPWPSFYMTRSRFPGLFR